MELKLVIKALSDNRSVVLIVPYGIETCIYCLGVDSYTVLIVPYGIETE